MPRIDSNGLQLNYQDSGGDGRRRTVTTTTRSPPISTACCPNSTFFSVGGDLKVTEDQRQEAIEMEKAAGDEALVACIDSFGRTDFRDDLAKITVPTLVLHGDSDATVPFEVSGKRTAATVTGAELVVIGDGPHGCNVSHADEFNQALVDFLGR